MLILMAPRGDRSLPSCLGGGDLDGDDFNLILDVGHDDFFVHIMQLTPQAPPTTHASIFSRGIQFPRGQKDG